MLQFLYIFAETDFINLVLFSNTIMIMRKPFLPILLFAFGAVSALISCKGSLTGDQIDDDVDVILAADVIDVADLTEIACDFRVHRLESDGPIEGIGGIKTWGDVMFARDNNSQKVLRFDNYKLTAVLNKMGRGPGEYTYVSDFTYDEAGNILSLENDFCAVSVLGVARPIRTVRMGNISMSKASDGFMAGTHRSDSLYTFLVFNPGSINQVVGIRLSASADESIAILSGIMAAYHEGDTITAQNVRLLCREDNVFQVLDIGPEHKRPGDVEFRFTLKNLKREIRVIRKNR